jgi:cap2 methyltransferase
LPEDKPFRTAHVCEAPGAFICATNFYYNQRYKRGEFGSFQRQWDWTGLTLNPYYEGNDHTAMVDDDRFIVETSDRWYFGEDNSGNILNPNNISGLWNRIRVSSNESCIMINNHLWKLNSFRLIQCHLVFIL